ncbi:DEP domain-containing protein 7 [Oryzias melastigma]|uniref:DEP domain-containing protein 7 n=1 Tax=Oryzias melastigma TaxID=30732 RepID=A0A3B3C1D6_ORYME|nr:DEP domain-containing protein 7 [Oryzias melastigma]
MASIKERAAALKLAEKLSVGRQAPGVSTAPPSSSSMWNGLISHLRSTVTVKRRLVHLKSHSDCFLGAEAVDVLADYIKQTKGSSVSRDKVMCVCQTLLECHVFEAVETKVLGKIKKRHLFQDSKNALYRFAGACTPAVDDLERSALENGIQRLLHSSSPDRLPEESHVQTSETPVKVGRQGALYANISLEPPVGNLSASKARTDSILPQPVVDEVWQEQTLLRLLHLVELPVLEGVLQCTHNPSSQLQSSPVGHADPDVIDSIRNPERQILKAFKNSQEDEWLCAALDCLDFLPDQQVVDLSREMPHCFPKCGEAAAQTCAEQSPLPQSGLAQFKLLLYGILVKHYSNMNIRPLLPQNLTDVYSAITDLLVKAKLDKALEAVQLCLKLLPQSNREELRRLLTFMSLAADPLGMRVDKETVNRLAVKKAFSRAILHGRSLSKEKEDILLVFMLSNIKEIFKTPGALHQGVSNKLVSLAQGKHPDMTGSTLNQDISSRTFADSTKKTTNKELWILLNNIYLDTKMSEKEKKRHLRQFNQAHPELFNQYFGDSAVSWL